MQAEENYFLYILNRIILGTDDEKITLLRFGSVGEYQKHQERNALGNNSPRILFTEDNTCVKEINLSDGYTIDVRSKDELAHWYDTLEIDITRNKVWAAFMSDGSPAIVFQPEKKRLCCLFDLKELVMRISCLKDETDRKDNHGRFLSRYHKNRSRWKIPMLEVLGKLIRSSFGFKTNESSFGVLMTHDVDWVSVEPIWFIRNLLKKTRFEPIVFNAENDYLYQNVKRLIEWDYEKEIRSTWYFMSGSYSFRRYGNRYSSKSRKLKKLIPILINRGHSLGLHTSYYGGFDVKKSQSQKEGLEKIIGREVAYNRNHYLRFDRIKSISLYEACGFKADSTMGYSDANGFRAGLCRPFYPWNYESKRVSNVVEIPLLFMDSVNSDNLPESWNDLKRILTWIKEVKGCGSLLFHPSNLASDPQRKEFYFEAIKECRRMNIPFLAIDNILNEYRGENGSEQ